MVWGSTLSDRVDISALRACITLFILLFCQSGCKDEQPRCGPFNDWVYWPVSVDSVTNGEHEDTFYERPFAVRGKVTFVLPSCPEDCQESGGDDAAAADECCAECAPHLWIHDRFGEAMKLSGTWGEANITCGEGCTDECMPVEEGLTYTFIIEAGAREGKPVYQPLAFCHGADDDPVVNPDYL